MKQVYSASLVFNGKLVVEESFGKTKFFFNAIRVYLHDSFVNLSKHSLHKSYETKNSLFLEYRSTD